MTGRKTDGGMLDEREVKLMGNAAGQLCLSAAGESFAEVSVRRAFPLEFPFRYISFLDGEGTEIGMIGDLELLEPASRELLREALHRTYFLPVVEGIPHIREEYGVIQADLETSSGPRRIEVRGYRRNVRPLSRGRALIEDVDGNRYELRDRSRLPKRTREILGL
jgi:hypothetical protein